MSKDTFLTIRERAEGFYKEKGSKFIGLAFYVETENDIKEKLEEVKKEYYDARHHCYAYRLGKEGDVWRANDDGEPSNSAGTPILNQIRSQELSNVLVVVVRYFGGTKLGVSGLITAYKIATQEALSNAAIYEKVLTSQLAFTFEYPAMNEVMKLVKDYELKIMQQGYELQCQMTLEIREKLIDQIKNKLLKIDTLLLLEKGS